MSYYNESENSEQIKLLQSAKHWWESKSRTKSWSELNIPQKQKVIKAYFNIVLHPTWESLAREKDSLTAKCLDCGTTYSYKRMGYCPECGSERRKILSEDELFGSETSLFLNSVCKNCGNSDFESIEEDGIIKKIKCKNCGDSIYGGETFDEQEHPRDNDGKFAIKAGDDKPKDTQKIVAKLSDTYHNLQPEFIISQIEKAEKLRNDAKATNESIQHDLKAIEDVKIFGRIKEVESMIGKLGRKPDEYKDVSDLNDVSGVRVMTKNINDVSKTISYIRSKYNVIQEENNIDHDRGGYRSYHVTVQDEHGVKSEIQIRTENQNAWANWCHDNFYKPKNQKLRQFYNEHKEVITNYSLGMSDYYYKKDIGIDVPRPVCPPEIEQVVGCMQ